MLLSAERAQATLPLFWLVVTVLTAAAVAVFLFPLFHGQMSSTTLLTATGIAAVAGLMLGTYVMYRSELGSSYSLGVFIYTLVMVELMFAGGAAALAAVIGDRPESRWVAFFSNALCMALSFGGGMWRGWRALGGRGSAAPRDWRERIGTHIDLTRLIVRPTLTNDATEGAISLSSSVWLAAVGAANVPLLFELYGGGRANAIFLVMPLLMGVLAYVNVKTLGPAFVRLNLLRKIEHAEGRKFQNADLAQIQDFRRGLTLSRWLMKGYSVPKNTVVRHAK